MKQIVKKSPLLPTFPTFFDDFFTKDFFDWNDKNFANLGSTLPSVNLVETDKSFKIELAAPGMKKKDFNIELKNGILTIKSEKKEEKEDKDKDGNFLRREFSYESFCRSFAMPDNTMEDDIKATYNDGILGIEIGKKELKKAALTKSIEIK